MNKFRSNIFQLLLMLGDIKSDDDDCDGGDNHHNHLPSGGHCDVDGCSIVLLVIFQVAHID